MAVAIRRAHWNKPIWSATGGIERPLTNLASDNLSPGTLKRGAVHVGRVTLTRFLRLPLLMVGLVLPVQHSNAAATLSTTVSTTAHGIKLTLTVPNHEYRRNDLVRLTVHIQKVTHHSVLSFIGAQCTQTNPYIDVLDSEGEVTPQFPPNMMLPPCPVGTGYPLAAGKSRTATALIVLNGDAVRAVLNVGRYLRKTVMTPTVAVKVAATESAPLVVQKSAHGTVLTVERPADAVGPLYVLDSTFCDQGHGTASLDGRSIWSPVQGNRISSGFSGTQQWHGFAGYLNYPVATINFTSP